MSAETWVVGARAGARPLGVLSVRATARRKRNPEPEHAYVLNPADWHVVRVYRKGGGGRTVGYVNSQADAVAIVAARQDAAALYAALHAAREMLVYPRGLTEGEVVALRKQIDRSLQTKGRYESGNAFSKIMPDDDRKPI